MISVCLSILVVFAISIVVPHAISTVLPTNVAIAAITPLISKNNKVTVDKFGVTEIYPTKPNGVREWYINASSPLIDKSFSIWWTGKNKFIFSKRYFIKRKWSILAKSERRPQMIYFIAPIVEGLKITLYLMLVP